MMQVNAVFYRSMLSSWETLLGKAAKFASSIPREHLINISQSQDGSDAIVTVWFWSETFGNQPLAREG